MRSSMTTWKGNNMGHYYEEYQEWNARIKTKALDRQEGGDHYTKMKIQPMTYSMENGLDAMQHTIIKYVSRFRDKNGIEDLRKAIHTIELLIEYEENIASRQ